MYLLTVVVQKSSCTNNHRRADVSGATECDIDIHKSMSVYTMYTNLFTYILSHNNSKYEKIYCVFKDVIVIYNSGKHCERMLYSGI